MHLATALLLLWGFSPHVSTGDAWHRTGQWYYQHPTHSHQKPTGSSVLPSTRGATHPTSGARMLQTKQAWSPWGEGQGLWGVRLDQNSGPGALLSVWMRPWEFWFPQGYRACWPSVL